MALKDGELVAQGEDFGDLGVVIRAQQAQGGEAVSSGQVGQPEPRE
ncbi:hypothetical protein [Streptomyces sp. NPDC004685]